MSINYLVDNQELKDATRIFTKLGKVRKNYFSETVFDFSKDKIEITFNGVTAEVKAQGTGKGRVRIKSGFMRYLNSGVKDQEEIKIWVEDSFIHIGSLALECDWDDISPKMIELSMDPPLGEVLLLRSQYTDDEIIASGFKPVLDQAEEDFSSIIEKVIKTLRPLHISRENLSSFLMSQAKSKYSAK